MWVNAALLIILTICVVTDLKSRKIYNNVIFPGVIFAIAFHAISGGWNGALEALLGLAAGFGILLIPFLLGGMGAGDVKLLALIGALKGTAFVWATGIYMALFRAAMALVIILFKDGFMNRIQYAKFIIICMQYRIKPDLRGHWTSGAYPYGVAIAGGAVCCLWTKGWIML